MNKRRITLLCLLMLMSLTLTACQSGPAVELPQAVSLGPGVPEAISATGDKLLVVRTLAEHNEGWLISSDGSTEEKILEFTSNTFYAGFSPDGKYLAWADEQLWLAQADGSEQRPLVTAETGIGPLAWSPDSTAIAFIRDGEIQITDLAGHVRTVAAAPESVIQLAWAALPTGEERLFFNSFPAEEPAFVSSMTIDGSDMRRLAEAEFFALQGDRLFLADPFEQGQLWSVNAADGSQAELLVESEVFNFAPRPSSAGEVVVLQQAGDIEYELWLVTPGRKPRQLTSNNPVLSPLWSPDGQTLYYGLFDLEAEEDVDEPFLVEKLDLSGY